MIPYGRQNINEEDIAAVVAVLRSDFLTQGFVVPEFEKAMAKYCNASYAIAVNSATSALHIAYQALGLSVKDEIWTSTITFVATANAALYCGATVDFVDIDLNTGNISVVELKAKLIDREINGGRLPKIVVPVHLGGLSCQMEQIYQLSIEYGFKIVEDASHAVGGVYHGNKIGSCKFSDITVFSFHPVKVMTTGEGGMALTNDYELENKMTRLRSHGIVRDKSEIIKKQSGSWLYQQIDLGYNYRMTEIQAALGLSQLNRLDLFIKKRNNLAQNYEREFSTLPLILPGHQPGCVSAFHLYSVRLDPQRTNRSRKEFFDYLRRNDIGVQVHYIPVHTQPYYQDIGIKGEFPNANSYYSNTISLPLYFDLKKKEQNHVIETVKEFFI